MKTTELHYFIEVAHCLSLTRASERLGISQPSLSISIKKLEKEVGVALLDRHKSGIRLTAGGQRFLQRARELLELWAAVKQSVYDCHHKIEGRLVLGCHPCVAMYHLPKTLPQLLIEHPNLHLSIVHGLSREINEQVINGSIDIGIVVNPIHHPDLIIMKLRDDKVGFWHHPELQFIDTKNITLLCDPSLHQSKDLIRRYKKKGGEFSRFIESQNLELLAKMAVEKAGVVIIPESIATAQQSIVMTSLEPKLYYKDTICLVFRHEKRSIQSVQAVKRCLMEIK